MRRIGIQIVYSHEFIECIYQPSLFKSSTDYDQHTIKHIKGLLQLVQEKWMRHSVDDPTHENATHNCYGQTG